MEELHAVEAATGTTLILNYEQCGYSSKDGMIGHLGVQMRMGNKWSLFLCFFMT